MKPVMHSLVASAALAALACLVSCAPPPPPEPPKPLQTPEQMVESARAVDAAFLAAFNAGDVEGIAATYWNSPETTFYMPDAMEAKGYDAIKAGFAQSLPAMPGCQLALTESHYRPIGDDTVFSSGLWTMTIPGEGGAPATESKGRFTGLMQRKNGTWVYVTDHASVPMAPPPDAAPATDAAATDAKK